MKKTTVLVVLDGWGVNPSIEGNAIAAAETPNIDKLNQYYPQSLLQASGISVGLPWGETGNSEVGHLTMGAGRINYQNFPRITIAIEEGTFFKNKQFLAAFKFVNKNKGKLHLMGLLSDGGVHSSLDHLWALMEMASKNSIEDVCLHLFTDGRDSPPTHAKDLIVQVGEKIKQFKCGRITTICGRYWAMDRNENWDRTQKAYELLFLANGKKAKSADQALSESYKKGVTDEFIEPTIIGEGCSVSDGDALIFFNFREDRVRQLTKAIISPKFESFERKKFLSNIFFVPMVEYDKTFNVEPAFPPVSIVNSLGEIISQRKLRQLRVAETEKYAHVTYFFNCGKEKPFSGEERILVPSKSVPTYDLAPEMSAGEITEKVVEAVRSHKYDFILVNYANADMVGHTGNFSAAVKAISFLDKCIGKLVSVVVENGGNLVITSDHGNAEEMINKKTGGKDTEHSNFPVPVWIVTPTNHRLKSEEEMILAQQIIRGTLCDIAPTICDLMDIPAAKEMIGKSLIDIITLNI